MLPHSESYDARSVPLKPRVNLETLIETALPSLPGNLMRIKMMLRDYNVSSRAISDAISCQPTLVVRLLRLVNSSLFLLEKNVTTIPVAINVIGLKSLHDIVMIELTSTVINRELRKSTVVRRIWEHSLVVALFSRELSEVLGMQGTEEAFTCGLLHDIGKIILLSYDSDGFSELLEIRGENDMLNGETQKYGYNHTEVGSLVARRWGLPEEIYYTILHHHNPSQSAQPMLVAHIVDVADIVANIKGYGVRQEDPGKLLFSESFIKLGLSEELLESCWSKIQGNIDQLIRSFT